MIKLPKAKNLLRKIHTKQDALAITRECGPFFIAFAIIYILLSSFRVFPPLSYATLFYALLLGAGGVWLRAKQSRVAAILLLSLGLLASLGAIASAHAESFPVLIVYVMVASQSVNAAFKFHKELRPPGREPEL